MNSHFMHLKDLLNLEGTHSIKKFNSWKSQLLLYSIEAWLMFNNLKSAMEVWKLTFDGRNYLFLMTSSDHDVTFDRMVYGF